MLARASRAAFCREPAFDSALAATNIERRSTPQLQPAATASVPTITAAMAPLVESACPRRETKTTPTAITAPVTARTTTSDKSQSPLVVESRDALLRLKAIRATVSLRLSAYPLNARHC